MVYGEELPASYTSKRYGKAKSYGKSVEERIEFYLDYLNELQKYLLKKAGNLKIWTEFYTCWIKKSITKRRLKHKINRCNGGIEVGLLWQKNNQKDEKIYYTTNYSYYHGDSGIPDPAVWITSVCNDIRL